MASLGRLKEIWRIPSVRSVVLLSLVMIVLLWGATAALLLELRQKELTHAQGETVALSRLLSEQTTRTFDGIVMMMQGIRERMEDDYGRHLQLDSLPVHLLLKTRSFGLPQVKSVFLIDQQGLGVNSSRSDFVKLLPMQHREFFRHFAEGGDGLFISRPEKARVDGQWTFYVSTPLKDGRGQFRGVLAAAINIEYFDSLYRSIDLDTVSQILLLNREGEILAGQVPHDEFLGRAFGIPKTLAGLFGKPENSTIEMQSDAEGRTRFAAFRAVASYPLFISASVDAEEALESWHEIVRPMGAGLFGVTLFVVITTLVLVRNLMRRYLLETALRESDERLRHVIASARDGIVTLDAGGQVMTFNPAAENLFCIPAQEAVGKGIVSLLAGCVEPAQVERIGRLFSSRRCLSGQECHDVIDLSRDGQMLVVELSLSRSQFRGEALLTAMFRDSTGRFRAEQALRDTNRRLQEMSAAMETVRESERTRIARELHDELGQLLTGIRMEVSWLGGRLAPEQPLLTERIATIKSQIDQTIASVRRISSELRPLVLDDLGFAAAAGWYIDQFAKRTGLSVDLVLPEDAGEPEGSVATALFRILQESMTNIARHAGATVVEIRLSCENDDWILSVRDNGCGFDVDAGGQGMGLIGMRERVQMLGGRFSVQSVAGSALVKAPGTGTQITARIPVLQDVAERKDQKELDGKVPSLAG